MALKTRAFSALVLIPPVLAAVWVGGWAFAGLAGLVAALMAWEWVRMTNQGQFTVLGGVIAAGLALACFATVINPLVGLALVLLIAVVSGLVSGRAWIGWGALYAGLPAVAIVWLRGAEDHGRDLLAALLVVVWVIDIAAYASGRLIGGPLLAPAISPKKTWAGLIGGMAGAALVGGGLAYSYGLSQLTVIAPLCALLAVVEQGGDFLESWIKRRWGVKDSSNLIPGHGGVMDRVDGLLAAGLVVALGKLIGEWI